MEKLVWHTGLSADGLDRPPLQVKFAAVSAAAAATTTLVAAVSGKKIRLLSLHANADAQATMTFQSAASTLFTFRSDGGSMHWTPVWGYICETAVGEALNVTTGAAQDLRGCLLYVEV